MNPRFRLRTLFVLMAASAMVALGVSVNFVCAFFCCVGSVAALVTYLSRFEFERFPLVAGIQGTLAGMLFSGVVLAGYTTCVSGLVEGMFSFFNGAAVGMLVSLVPVSLIGLIPGPKIKYLGERNPKSDRSASSIVPYIGGQG